MDCMDVSLAKKKGRFRGGVGARCLLPSGSNWGKGMGGCWSRFLLVECCCWLVIPL